LSREDVFITNAALCCPADDRRNNTPTASEVRNCRTFLQRTIELLQPPVIATVGAVALKAITPLLGEDDRRGAGKKPKRRNAETPKTDGKAMQSSRGRGVPRSLKLSDVAGTVVEGAGFRLVPLFHPSPRVLNTTRSLGEQRKDFCAIRQLLGR
jgi:uracil-DNA glycosylase